MDLYLLNKFHVLPGGQSLDNLYPDQKWFLVASEALMGDLRGLPRRAQETLRLEILDRIKADEPLSILPKGMASAISRAGLDPLSEAFSRIDKMKEKIQKKIAEE